ncbi:hypothetical protein [Kordiimonas lacus]|uniref:Uncharacterized protein n=1 Tax=Kordiimonas lacus TaxID=637679 RepID=A0A1G7D7S1_9PROT|nr:hypothetical protein [Kordiimonas lacus]SDE46976.1 hypothetical protein SAMN04488071_2974 [Kordiimonas lacus]
MNMQPADLYANGDLEEILSPTGVLKKLSAAERYRSGTPLRAFDVSVFNGEVRACMKNNEDHPIFSSRWADTQHVVMIVMDEIELAARIRTLFPTAQGFVIENIVECHASEVV